MQRTSEVARTFPAFARVRAPIATDSNSKDTMPAPALSDLGPLGPLAGTWEGDAGTVEPTPSRERTTFNAFGPVDNCARCLFGLDSRTRRGGPAPCRY
jgi:hypothetical protein